jgi:hypothetical protein
MHLFVLALTFLKEGETVPPPTGPSWVGPVAVSFSVLLLMAVVIYTRLHPRRDDAPSNTADQPPVVDRRKH